MAISVQCESCWTTFRVKDDLAGSRVRCKSCGAVVRVPDGEPVEEPLPLPAKTVSRKSQKRGKKSSAPGPMLWLGAAAGLLLIVVAVLVGGRFFGRGPSRSADDPQPNVSATAPASPPSTGSVSPGSPTPESTSPVGPASSWKVQADPPAEVVTFSENAAVELPMPSDAASDWAVYPATSNAFVAVGSNFRPDDVREVWDLRSGQKVGTIQTDVGAERGALSPDGRHFAAMSRTKDKILLFDVARGQQVAELAVAKGNVSPVMAFAGPTRLVTTYYQQTLEVWSVPSGQRVHSITLPKFLQPHSLAVSPGGRYAALVIRDDDTKAQLLRIYDLDAGTLAGVVPLERYQGKHSFYCDGLAFSPDGDELAGLLRSNDGAERHWLIGWNLRTGEVAFEHSVAPELRSNAVSGTNESVEVRWFPGQKWLLLFGRYLFDREIGGPIWKVPEDKELTAGATTVIADDRMLVVAGPYKKRAIRTIVLPHTEIVQSTQAVKAGGLPEDAGLPPLTVADTAHGQTLTFPSSSVPWSVTPDPAPQSTGTLLSEPIPVPAGSEAVGSLLVTAGNGGRAFVALDRGEQSAQLLCYELSRPGEPSRTELPFAAHVLACTADGTRVLTRVGKSPGRLDVWSVPDGKHVLGWRPFQESKEQAQRVVAAAFVDAAHVLTLSAGRTLALWELPACRRLYSVENVDQAASALLRTWGSPYNVFSRPPTETRTANTEPPVQPVLNPGLPAISPGGRFIAFLHAGQLLFLEAVTGTLCGAVAVEGGLAAAAFNPSATQFAALLTRPGGGTLLSIDLTAGTIASEFPLPQSGSWLRWCNDEALLLDNRLLIDRRHQRVVWKYLSPDAVHSPDSPDGRHWALVRSSSQSRQLTLTAYELPEPAVAAKLEGSVAAPVFALGPGKAVSFRFDLKAQPPNDNTLEAQARQHLTDELNRHGIAVQDGERLSVVVSSASRATGVKMSFRPLLNASGASETIIDERRIDCKVAVHQSGREIWSHIASFSNHRYGLTRLKPGESIEDHLSQQQWAAVSEFFTQVSLPSHLFPDGAENGLGTSLLTPRGVQPVGK